MFLFYKSNNYHIYESCQVEAFKNDVSPIGFEEGDANDIIKEYLASFRTIFPVVICAGYFS